MAAFYEQIVNEAQENEIQINKQILNWTRQLHKVFGIDYRQRINSVETT